jgi:hypothetical protein
MRINKINLIADYILSIIFVIFTVVGWALYSLLREKAPPLWYLIMFTVYTIIKIVCILTLIGVDGYDKQRVVDDANE